MTTRDTRGGSSPWTVAIVGAGVSGICSAIKLREAGITDFVILEKAASIGGTWRDNTYPGAACDVRSHFYSFSFEPNPDWSRVYSPQPEILAYFERCVAKYGVSPHIRFNQEVTAATFDEDRGLWCLAMGDGTSVEARTLILGCGQLNRPAFPAIAGRESFAGPAFHSARWDHTVDLAGKRVASIGNGASAIQYVPEVAREAGHLTVFQRSANWIVAREDRPYTEAEKQRFRNVPLARLLARWKIYLVNEYDFLAFLKESWLRRRREKAIKAWLEEVIPDPALRATQTPDYPLGCKRILVSSDYFPALNRPNVDVVTSPITRIRPDGIETADGAFTALDVIIYGTGFETMSFVGPIAVTGRDGRHLDEAWSHGAEAHLGITVAGFPNLFVCYGPNTNLGHHSIIFMIECQVRYIVACIREIVERDLAVLDVREEAMARFNREVQDAMKKTVWEGGCHSWYKTADGKVTNNWSGPIIQYWMKTRRPDFTEYEEVPRRA